ncbi:MAG: TetR family transcriptional regulator [Actinomyces urogenitalis]|uniref:TetR/AcrR family transcriptional regulator n=1 Tax=Actinomyces urogenitalis TaxID=103621 RepID=UPI002A824C5E|nr:TetR family transcriptional regulator [Actinomyces urogenitalis]MDY3677712.1 TetR family transcriptional regulator [Actinomyces urogenitalis]
MRSVHHASPAEASAADRIRDAAINQFAQHGFAHTTVRAVATAAGVSPALVIHHFGSKDGLRQACDEYVLDAVMRLEHDHAAQGPFAVAQMLSDPTHRVQVEYLVRSMRDPSDVGQRFFDYYVDTIERTLREGFAGYRFRVGEDARAQAVALAMIALAPALLEPRAHSALGTTDMPSLLARLAPSLYDFYRHGVIAAEPASQEDSHPSASSESNPSDA